MDFAFWLMIGGWIFVLIWVPFVVFTQRKVHPKALFVLFFAELWERFSFYGMRALLTLYMVAEIFKILGEEKAQIEALAVYGSYGALVYAAPVLGGLLADRVMGFRKAIILGGALMALGHFAMAFEGNVLIFFAALGLIIVGNGFFKPNISSFLGEFYEKNDIRKDGAFSIFYMGVNIGAFLAPLTCGWLGNSFGWFWGFGLAGVGMVAGLIVFWLFSLSGETFGDKGKNPPKQEDKPKVFLGLTLMQLLVIVGSLAAVPIMASLLKVNEFTKIGMVTVGLGLAAVMIGLSIYKVIQGGDQKKEGLRLLVVCVLFFFHMIFWALFEQAGGSLTLLAEKYVNREVFGTEIPTAMFQSLNPLFIMLLAPVFSWLWMKLRKKDMEPAAPFKFSAGLLQLALGFLVIVVGAKMFVSADMFESPQDKVPLIFLVLMYFLHTTGELSISPVGLSLVTKLSPGKIVGFVMGFWFLSISLAHEVAATLGELAASPEEGASDLTALNTYADVYTTWGVYLVGGAAVLLFLLSFLLKRWMQGIK